MRGEGARRPWRWFWCGAAVISFAFYFFLADLLPRAATRYPARWRVPLKDDISAFMDWLVEDAEYRFMHCTLCAWVVHGFGVGVLVGGDGLRLCRLWKHWR